MKIFYKIIIIFGLIVFIIIAAFVLFLTYKMPFNNYHLKVFRDNFHKSVDPLHPKQSILIVEIAELDNWGNSNQCQYLVGQFRSSPLSKETLGKLYPDDFLTAGVYFIDDDEAFSYSPWSEWREKYLLDYKPKNNENVYLIWAADEDSPPDGDIRCH